MIDDYDNEDYDYFNEWDLEQAKKEYLKLHLIIKEVREYIEALKNFKIKYVMFEEKELYASENDFVKDILEILDKANKENL